MPLGCGRCTRRDGCGTGWKRALTAADLRWLGVREYAERWAMHCRGVACGLRGGGAVRRLGRQEAQVLGWLAPRCWGCRFGCRLAMLRGPDAAWFSKSMPRRRRAASWISDGGNWTCTRAALGQMDGEPCGNGVCECMARGGGGGLQPRVRMRSGRGAPRASRDGDGLMAGGALFGLPL